MAVIDISVPLNVSYDEVQSAYSYRKVSVPGVLGAQARYNAPPQQQHLSSLTVGNIPLTGYKLKPQVNAVSSRLELLSPLGGVLEVSAVLFVHLLSSYTMPLEEIPLQFGWSGTNFMLVPADLESRKGVFEILRESEEEILTAEDLKPFEFYFFSSCTSVRDTFSAMIPLRFLQCVGQGQDRRGVFLTESTIVQIPSHATFRAAGKAYADTAKIHSVRRIPFAMAVLAPWLDKSWKEGTSSEMEVHEKLLMLPIDQASCLLGTVLIKGSVMLGCSRHEVSRLTLNFDKLEELQLKATTSAANIEGFSAHFVPHYSRYKMTSVVTPSISVKAFQCAEDALQAGQVASWHLKNHIDWLMRSVDASFGPGTNYLFMTRRKRRFDPRTGFLLSADQLTFHSVH